MKEKLFYLGIGLFFTHELDAMTNHEWRVLPLTSWMPELQGELAFVLLHIPLFAVLVGLIASQNALIRRRSWTGIAIFLAVHGFLHAAFMVHDQYEFSSLLSNGLIFGAAICGAAYLVLNRSRVRADTE